MDYNSISAISPVYNSEKTLKTLIKRLESVLKPLTTNYEIFLINDNSFDTSWNEIHRIAARNKHVVGINFMRNFGQHNTILCAILKAKYEGESNFKAIVVAGETVDFIYTCGACRQVINDIYVYIDIIMMNKNNEFKIMKAYEHLPLALIAKKLI